MSEEETSPAANSHNENGTGPSFSEWLSEPQTMIGLSAIVLSLCGLFISLYEASLIRQEQRASVWPHVQLGPSFQSGTVSFHVQNAGVGPARIRAAAVKYKGQTKASWEDFLQHFERDTNLEERIIGDPDLGRYLDFINGNVLPPNSPMDDIFRLTAVEEDSASREVLQALRQRVEEGIIDITLCYCSVYEECWATSLQSQYVRTQSPERNTRSNAPQGTRRVESCEGKDNSEI